MFQISDDNPRRHLTPYVNYGLIGVCVLVFLWQLSLGQRGEEAALYQLGMIPARPVGRALGLDGRSKCFAGAWASCNSRPAMPAAVSARVAFRALVAEPAESGAALGALRQGLARQGLE